MDDTLTTAGATMDANTIAALRRPLVAWYARHKRTLPWREATGADGRPDPYAVWIAEVMLQQTQVATVVPYFTRWMARFPDARALAAAPLEDVLACWQGLGYYARARNLRRAAAAIVDRHGGRLPADVALLRALPGVGDYTAGAIASIAFGLPAAAIDGNVRRVLARLAAIDGDPSRGAAARAIHRLAETLVAGSDAPGDLNQALMELGATVCRPRNPDCGACPVSAPCAARRLGRVAELPAKGSRARQRVEHKVAFALYQDAGRRSADARRWLIARRPEHGLLGGLWEFPLLAADPGTPPETTLRETFGIAVTEGRAVGTVTHVFTHIRLTAVLFTGQVQSEVRTASGDYRAWRWVDMAALDSPDLPTSTLMTKLVAMLDRRE